MDFDSDKDRLDSEWPFIWFYFWLNIVSLFIKYEWYAWMNVEIAFNSNNDHVYIFFCSNQTNNEMHPYLQTIIKIIFI